VITFRTAQLTVAHSPANEDRAAIVAVENRVVLAVADGAGGSGEGAHAAEAVVDRLRASADRADFDVAEFLSECDHALAREGSGGETTAVVIVVDESGIRGASVGDSQAWIIAANQIFDLTERQVRRPFIGTGGVTPIAFSRGRLDGTLLLGTDGLFNYASVDRIRKIAAAEDFDGIPTRLIDCVRLRSGALQDDVTAIVCRARRSPSEG
jgi:serine/threonine protein phosphatase PrpC